jgi:hypothetical protein
MTYVGALPSTIWLSREDRRALARRDRQPAPAQQQRRACLCCYAPLPNGEPVCSEECDELWWRIVPTVDGELFLPA